VSSEPANATKDLLELDDPAHSPEVEAGGVEHAAPAPVARPTVIPKYNPPQHAEEAKIRERMSTLTDESAQEQARLQSFPTNAPPPRRPMSTLPGPLVANPRDSSVEIDVGEDDIDALGPDEQVAILRAGLMPMSRVPALARQLSEIGAALEDPKTAYVIGFVDGILPIETIVDVTGLPELDTLRVLDRLVAQGILIFRSRV